jgi:hypothetical protein
VTCDDGNGCTTDACNAGLCEHAPNPVPVQVQNLRVSSTQIDWDAVFGLNGGYDLLRGLLDELPVGSNPSSEACPAQGITGTTFLDGAPLPDTSGYFYLVRAKNECGPGSYDDATSLPRVTPTCP